MTRKKKQLTKKQARSFVPKMKEFNTVAGQFMKLLGVKIKHKEDKISIMVSRVSRPKAGGGRVNIKTVDISSDFISKQRKKAKQNQGSSEWDATFSSKRGYVI